MDYFVFINFNLLNRKCSILVKGVENENKAIEEALNIIKEYRQFDNLEITKTKAVKVLYSDYFKHYFMITN